MASDTDPTALPLDHSNSPHTSKSHRLGLADLGSTPRDASATEIDLGESIPAELTHALKSTGPSTTRSPITTSQIDNSARSPVRTHSHNAPTLPSHHGATSFHPSEKITSSSPTDSLHSRLSDRMAQNHQNHVGSRGSTQHLNPHIFTLTVPPEKALAIRSILEKLQDDFDLGDSGLTWKVKYPTSQSLFTLTEPNPSTTSSNGNPDSPNLKPISPLTPKPPPPPSNKNPSNPSPTPYPAPPKNGHPVSPNSNPSPSATPTSASTKL